MRAQRGIQKSLLPATFVRQRRWLRWIIRAIPQKKTPCGLRPPSVKLGDEHAAAKVVTANSNHRVCLRPRRRRGLGNYWTVEHCAVRSEERRVGKEWGSGGWP